MARVDVVAGAQYGSEAKGAIAGFLCRDMSYGDVSVRVAGPNAGHTAYDKDGREWKLRTIPVGAVTNPKCQLVLAAGSEVDPSVLIKELDELDAAGHNASARLTIHPSATVIIPSHKDTELLAGMVGKIGSTAKGIGAARADRAMRTALTWGNYAEGVGPRFSKLTGKGGPFDLNAVGHVVIEGTQGYGLGLHTRNYPQVTSSDCRAIDFLAMAGISPWGPQVGSFQVYLVARTYPIRVAGNSGPMKDETSWAELGLPEERTTVTNNIRRVGGWDLALVQEAVEANGGGDWVEGVTLCVTMLDQLFPEVKGAMDGDDLSDRARQWLHTVEDQLETEIEIVGTSPTTHFLRGN